MNARRLAIAWFVLLTPMMTANPASAARYDLQLGRYFDNPCNSGDGSQDLQCAQQLFEALMTELGQISAPVFLAPAETLGLNGFAFSLEGTIAPISGDESFWSSAAEGDPGSVIFIPHLHVRKGLPFSVEVGAQLSYIPESELFVAGAELKWALNEGFYFIPDVAVRLAINHMIGAKDFELSTGGWDISLSKSFGVGGMMALTPYAGYHMLFLHATSHVVTKLDPDAVDPDDRIEQKVFDELNWQDNLYHRFFVGLRLTTFIFQLVAEGAFTLDGPSVFSFKLGFDY